MTYRLGNLYGTYANRPTAGQAGRVYTPSDGPVSYIDNGTTWLPMIPGVGTPGSEVAPSNTNPFTFISAGSGVGASLSTNGGTVSMTMTSNAASSQAVQLADVNRSGNTGPQGWFRTRGAQVSSRGIYVRDSSSGKLLMFGFDVNSGINTAQELVVLEYNSQTSFNVAVFADLPHYTAEPVGLRLRNDGTNYYAEICINGTTWYTVYQQAVAAWVPSAGNKCGFYASPYSASCELTCLAWNVQ